MVSADEAAEGLASAARARGTETTASTEEERGIEDVYGTLVG